MKKLQFLKNKIFIKWVKHNIIVIIIGVSIILNIIYLPKYFSGQSTNNQNVTTISLEAINTTNKSTEEKVLTRTTYITTFKTLGSLLNACTNQFKIKKFSTMNLHYLYGVANDKGTMINQNDNKNWWQVESWNGKNFVQTKMGIDDTLLTNNNRFQFELTIIA